MIISRGRRYIFVHIPKTGGTALGVALEARAMADDILVGDTPKARARAGRLEGLATVGRLWKHSTMADIDGLLTRAELDQLLVFTLVRNPWDRLVSLYHWLRDQSFTHPMVATAKAADFSGFLNDATTLASVHAAPFGSYLRHPSVNDGLFIRIEHFARDAAPLEAHLGFALAPLPVTNSSNRCRDWRGYYNDRDATLAAALCAEDIARFDYRFDP